MTVGIVSAGHMGSGLGWALREGGARVITTLAGRSGRTARLAAAAGLESVPDMASLVRAAQVVLVVTPPDAACAAATEIVEAVRQTGASPQIADLNAVAPSTVDGLTETYAGAGLSFVDGSVSGPPPNVRPGARIFLSGPQAAHIADLPWRHVMPIVLPGPAGKASALKMCTASVYKGLDGLIAQALRSAQRYGVLDATVAELHRGGHTDVGRLAIAATKASRFVPEMREIAAAQGAAGLTPALFTAFAEVYAEIATSRLAAADPETVDRGLSPSDVIAGITPENAPY